MKTVYHFHIALLLFVLILTAGCAHQGGKKMKSTDKARIYYDTGVGYLGKGEAEKAIDALKKSLELDDKNAAAMQAMGLCYFQMNMLDSAEMWFSKAMKITPDDPDLQNNFASLYLKQHQYQKAIDLAAKALDHTNYVTPAAAYYNMGMGYFGLKNLNEAALNFKHAIKHEPFFDRAHLMLGRIYLETGDYEKAIKFFSNAVKVNEKNVDAYLYRGIAFWNRGYVTEAEKDFKRILRIAPSQSPAALKAKEWIQKIQ